MTLPSGPFVCKNIDVIWWCEAHRQPSVESGDRATYCTLTLLGPYDEDEDGPCRMVERGLVDPGEVIPVEVDYSNPPLGDPMERFRSEWQPVVSDKE
jgi:hypothetical protein